MTNSNINKIAIIADIHSNYFLLNKLLNDIKKRNITEICFLGDYITDGFENNAIIDLIKQYNYVIAGNRDLSVANYDGFSWDNSEQFKNMLYAYNDITTENIMYLKTLPSFKLITINNKKICLSHGTPLNNREIVTYNSFDIFDKLIQDFNCDIFLFAHTHEAYCTNYKDKLFINPGSVILPADSPSSKYGILDLESMDYEQVTIPYDLEEIKNYYLDSNYFLQNREWCNILIYTNKNGIDYICAFIDFIKEKAQKENIDIKKSIPNNLWHTSFLEFMNFYGLDIY